MLHLLRAKKCKVVTFCNAPPTPWRCTFASRAAYWRTRLSRDPSAVDRDGGDN